MAEKRFVGAVGTVAAPTNQIVGAVGTVAAPTNRFIGAVWEHQPPLQIDPTNRFEGAATVPTAPTNYFSAKKIKFTIQIRPEHIFFMHNNRCICFESEHVNLQ